MVVSTAIFHEMIVIRAYPRHPRNLCSIVFQEFELVRKSRLISFLDGAALWAGCCIGFL